MSVSRVGIQYSIILFFSFSSNETGTLYPYTPDPSNQAAIQMYTEEEIKKNNYKVGIEIMKFIKTSFYISSLLDLPWRW